MFHGLTDDQIVLLLCLGAFAIAASLTAMSYWLGSARKQALGTDSTAKLTAHLEAARAARKAA